MYVLKTATASHFVQEGYQSVKAVPYDLPVVGYGNYIVNTLRIWDAEPVGHLNLDSLTAVITRRQLNRENLVKNIAEVLIQTITIMQVKNCV